MHQVTVKNDSYSIVVLLLLFYLGYAQCNQITSIVFNYLLKLINNVVVLSLFTAPYYRAPYNGAVLPSYDVRPSVCP